MLLNYFDYIFVHLKQKVRLRPKLSPKFLSTLSPNPARKTRPDLQLCGAVLWTFFYKNVYAKQTY